MDSLEEKYKMILIKEQQLNEREKALIQRENEYKIALAHMTGNIRVLNEYYDDIDTKQVDSLTGHLYH